MQSIKFSICMLVVITIGVLMMSSTSSASRHGEKIHFQDSSEVGEFDIDESSLPGIRAGNRNHRGRAEGHQKHNNKPEFEEGLPGVYPIRGPPQAPLVLPSSQHPGRGVGLQNHLTQTTFQTPPQQQTPLNTAYAGNPFLSKLEIHYPTTPTTTKTEIKRPVIFPGATNQLRNEDKPITTTTPYSVNPRRFDLLYGSNLLEEENQNREGKTQETTTISFNDRGLFDTAPHCQPGQILVNNKCRMAV